MIRSSITCLAAVLLCGCASQQVSPEDDAEAKAPLYCANKTECDFYWQRAQIWIAEHSTYRIQSVTDVVISTHGPLPNDVRLAFQVTRIPNPDGSAQIKIGAGCANMFGCNPPAFVSMAAFKRYLRSSK